MDDGSSPILAKGLLKFVNKGQQHAGILNVILRYLSTLFTMQQLAQMQSTVLNCIEVVVDVRRGPRAVLPTSKTQCIPVPLRQLREINEHALRVECDQLPSDTDPCTAPVASGGDARRVRSTAQQERCARLLALVVVHVLPDKTTMGAATTGHVSYTRAYMYWVGVISTHSPHVVHATLRKAGQNVCDATTSIGAEVQSRGVLGGDGGGAMWGHVDVLPVASLEDCKLVRIGDLTNTRMDLVQFLMRWHEWRARTMPGSAPLGRSLRESSRHLVHDGSKSSIVTLDEEHRYKEEVRSEAEPIDLCAHESVRDVGCVSADLLPHSSLRLEDSRHSSSLSPSPSPSPPSSSPLPSEESVCAANVQEDAVASCPLPHREEKKHSPIHQQSLSIPTTTVISASTSAPFSTAATGDDTEDSRLGHLAASLLVARRPLERATDSVNFAFATCLARQRLMVLADLMRDGVECVQFGQVQMLQYVNHNAVSSAAHYTSKLTRRTEAQREERQCAAFLVCMAACITERRVCAWYVDAETLLGECLYRTLCNNSNARQCAYEQVPELNNTNAHETLDAYRMDTQVQWTQMARRRALATMDMLHHTLAIDADSGMVSDQSPSIPTELEDALCELKGLLLALHQQHCANTEGDEEDPQKDGE